MMRETEDALSFWRKHKGTPGTIIRRLEAEIAEHKDARRLVTAATALSNTAQGRRRDIGAAVVWLDGLEELEEALAEYNVQTL
jgi:hypothetical protein